MMKYILIFTLLFSQFTFASWQESVTQKIQTFQTEYQVTHFQIYFGSSGKELWRLQPLSDKDLLFDLASITKVFTAISINKAIEEKKLSLTTKVKSVLPDYINEKTTIEDLLRHRSGLKPGIYLDSYDPEVLWEKVFQAKEQEYYGRFKYSNINFLLLGKVLEKIYANDIAEVLKQNIVIPLALESTLYKPSGNQCASTGKKTCIVHDPTSDRLGGITGHAGVFSTLDDLAVIARSLLKDEKILKRETIQLMTQKVNNSQRGLGVDISSAYSNRPRGKYFTLNKSYGHTGFTGTSLWIDPVLDRFIIVLTNTVGAPDWKAAKKRYLNLLPEITNDILNHNASTQE